MHAQGQVALVDPKRHDLTPWAEVDLERWREPVTKALREGGERALGFEDIVLGVRKRWFKAWTLGESLMITEVIVSPRVRGLHVFVSCGDLNEIRELIPAIEEFARQAGCTMTGATGRKGWLRVLARFGYAPAKLHTVVKDL